MPHDLFIKSPTPTTAPPTVASPETKTPTDDGNEEDIQSINMMRLIGSNTRQTSDGDSDRANDKGSGIQHSFQRITRLNRVTDRDQIVPYVQSLSLTDLESCITLEHAIFPPKEQCSKETMIYRLTAASNLCLGLFISMNSPVGEPGQEETSTYYSAGPVETSAPDRKKVLIGMVVATKSVSKTVTDGSMRAPTAFLEALQAQHSVTSAASHAPSNNTLAKTDGAEVLGSEPQGRTILVHTLGIHPTFQGKGYGAILMKSYQQRMETSGIADRISIISHDNELVSMYKGFGFERATAPSSIKFGGGGWVDLSYEFAEHELGT